MVWHGEVKVIWVMFRIHLLRLYDSRTNLEVMAETKLDFLPWNLTFPGRFSRNLQASHQYERVSGDLCPRCNPRTRRHWVVRHAERQPTNVGSGCAVLALVLQLTMTTVAQSYSYYDSSLLDLLLSHVVDHLPRATSPLNW
jgi:hypothetical protein